MSLPLREEVDELDALRTAERSADLCELGE